MHGGHRNSWQEVRGLCDALFDTSTYPLAPAMQRQTFHLADRNGATHRVRAITFPCNDGSDLRISETFITFQVFGYFPKNIPGKQRNPIEISPTYEFRRTDPLGNQTRFVIGLDDRPIVREGSEPQIKTYIGAIREAMSSFASRQI